MVSPKTLAFLIGAGAVIASGEVYAQNFPLYPIQEPDEKPAEQLGPRPVPPVPAPTPVAQPVPVSQSEPPLNTNPVSMEPGVGYSLLVRNTEDARTDVHRIPFTLVYRFSPRVTGAVDGDVDIVRRHTRVDDQEETAGYTAVRAGPRIDLDFDPVSARLFAYLGRDDRLFERRDENATSLDAGLDLSFDISDSVALQGRAHDRYHSHGNLFEVYGGVRKALSPRFAITPGVSHVEDDLYGNSLTSGSVRLAYANSNNGVRLALEGIAGERSGGSFALEFPLRRENDVVLALEGEGHADDGNTDVAEGRGMALLRFPIRSL